MTRARRLCVPGFTPRDARRSSDSSTHASSPPPKARPANPTRRTRRDELTRLPASRASENRERRTTTPRRLVGVLALALFALAGVHATTHARAEASSPSSPSKQNSTPKRLIFFLSDGMGPAHLTLARDSGACGDALVLDDHLVGASRTRSTDSLVTDSAAGATAYATGHRTYNRVVGEVPEGADRDVDFTGEGRGVQSATSSRRPIARRAPSWRARSLPGCARASSRRRASRTRRPRPSPRTSRTGTTRTRSRSSRCTAWI